MTDALSSKKRKLEAGDTKDVVLPDHVFIVEEYTTDPEYVSESRTLFYDEKDARAELLRRLSNKESFSSQWDEFWSYLAENRGNWASPDELLCESGNFKWPVDTGKMTRALVNDLQKEIDALGYEYDIDVFADHDDHPILSLTLAQFADWFEGKTLPAGQFKKKHLQQVKEAKQVNVWLSCHLFACPSAVHLFALRSIDGETTSSKEMARVIQQSCVAMLAAENTGESQPCLAVMQLWDAKCRAAMPDIFVDPVWGEDEGALRMVKLSIR